MQNVVILGSCLSEITVNFLEELGEFKKIYHGMHLRTDILLSLLNGDNKKFLKHHELELALRAQKVDLKKNAARIKFQSREYLEDLKEKLLKVDIVVMDFNYDLSRKGYSFIEEENTVPYIFNFQELMENEKYRNITPDEITCKDQGLLSPQQSIKNIHAIIRLLQSINKEIEIFIINYPYSGFNIKNKRSYVPKRVEVSKTLGTLVEKEFFKNVNIIPLLDIKESLLSDKGGHYFDQKVYKTYAEYIKDKLMDKNSSLEIFDTITNK